MSRVRKRKAQTAEILTASPHKYVEKEVHSCVVTRSKFLLFVLCAKAESTEDVFTITFDLQKTLPLPKLTSVAFYLWQIWLYNVPPLIGLSKVHVYSTVHAVRQRAN